MSSGKVPDECGPVHRNKTALWAVEGCCLSQEGRDLILEVDDEVIRPVLGGHQARADLTLVCGGGVRAAETGQPIA